MSKVESKQDGSKQSEPRIKAAPAAEERRAAERVTLRRRYQHYGPDHECSVGELVKRLFDTDGHADPDLAECAMEQVAEDLYTLAIAIEMGREALDADAITKRLTRLRSYLQIAAELGRRDRQVNSHQTGREGVAT
jgi:hypothetical protein